MLLEDGRGIETREHFLGFGQVRAIRHERSKLFEGCRAPEGETMIGERVAQGLDVDNACVIKDFGDPMRGAALMGPRKNPRARHQDK